MRRILMTTILGLSLLASNAFAMDVEGFKKIAGEVVKEVLSGEVKDVDALIAKNEALLQIGLVGCEEYKVSNPEWAALMTLVIDNADNMKKMSLEEIEPAWHDGEFLVANGIDFDAIDHYGAAISHMDAVLHPATAIIALNDYKTSKNPDLLEQVKDEIGEVLEHLKHVQ